MKMIFSLLQGLSVVAIAIPAHALVRELALCSTADSHYQVSVQDNEGIGFVRTPHLSANVIDSSGKIVASYEAEVFHGIQSISFGRSKYQDSATSGEGFTLEGPSTNFKNYILNVKMNVNGESSVISDADLSCSVFGGTVVGQ